MTLNRRALLALCLVCAAGCAPRPVETPPPVDRLTAIRQNGVVRIGITADSPPFGTRVAGEMVGFDVDLATAIGTALGVKRVELMPVPVADRIPLLQAGKVDLVVAAMTISRRRERLVDFSLSYFVDGQGLLVRNDSPVQSYLDLAGKPVGAVKGSTSADNIARVAPSARLQLFPSHSAQLAALRAGQLDAITGDSVILKSLAAEAPGLRLAGEAFSYEPYGIAVGQGESALRDAINEILQQLWEDGRYRSIYDTWFGPRTPYAGLALPALRPFPP